MMGTCEKNRRASRSGQTGEPQHQSAGGARPQAAGSSGARPWETRTHTAGLSLGAMAVANGDGAQRCPRLVRQRSSGGRRCQGGQGCWVPVSRGQDTDIVADASPKP